MVYKTKRGFTLIELLVVIAIIAILAAILFPVFLNAKKAAMLSQCLSNCKQIATGLSLYKDDNSGYWMCAYDQAGSASGRPGFDPVYRYAFWMRAIDRYVKGRRVFACPVAKDKFGKWADYGSEPTATWPAANYGINECLVLTIWAQLAGTDSLSRDSAIPYTSKTALVADCNSVIFWGGDGMGTQFKGVSPDNGQTYPDGMLRMMYPNAPKTATTYNSGDVRHDGKTTVVFVDLHVRALHTNEFRIQNVDGPPSAVRMNPIIWPKAKPM